MGAIFHPLPPGEPAMGLEGTWGSWQWGSGCSKGTKRAGASEAPRSRVQPVARGDPPPGPSPGTCLPSESALPPQPLRRAAAIALLVLGCQESPKPEQLLLHPHTSGEVPWGMAPGSGMHQGHQHWVAKPRVP